MREAKRRAELAVKRRAALSPWESRLGRPKAIDAIIAAAREALDDPVAWPTPEAAAAAAAARERGGGGGGGGGAGDKGGKGFFGGLFGGSKGGKGGKSDAAAASSAHPGVTPVWGLPTLVADALYSACAACGYEAGGCLLTFCSRSIHVLLTFCSRSVHVLFTFY